MKIKSYFSRTVEEAMAQATLELGPDAMLVDSRKAPPEARRRGEYEVVFAIDAPAGEQAAEPADATPEAISFGGSSADSSPERFSRDLVELKKELEGMRRALTRSVIAPANLVGASPDLSDAYAVLTAGDVPPELAREVVERAQSRLGGSRSRTAARSNKAGFRRALVEELEARFTVQPALGRGDARPAIVALVGPPGAGKTTTLVKLAVNYGLAARRPVLLLTMDTYRIAASEQLRCFASILGVGFHVLETTSAVAQAIEENRGKDLILIDTPGFAFQDMEDAAGLAHFLAGRSDIDTQLVLSASMKPADLSRVIDAFEVFRPQRLLFTKLDETVSYGSIFSEAARTGKPLSFFAAGQRIPEDLEAASRNRLLELMLTGRYGEAVSAA